MAATPLGVNTILEPRRFLKATKFTLFDSLLSSLPPIQQEPWMPFTLNGLAGSTLGSELATQFLISSISSWIFCSPSMLAKAYICFVLWVGWPLESRDKPSFLRMMMGSMGARKRSRLTRNVELIGEEKWWGWLTQSMDSVWALQYVNNHRMNKSSFLPRAYRW